MREEILFIFRAASLGVFLSASHVLCAQTPTPIPTPVLTPITASTAQAQPSDEVVALRAQLEIMRQYDERLLATVYYSLGALGGVVVLVIGLGWYTNFRSYKRESEELRRETEETKRELKNDIDNQVNSIRSSLREELIKEARAHANNAVTPALRNLRNIQFKMLGMEAEKWSREKVEENALRTYTRMLELSIEDKNDYEIVEVIDQILRILKTQKLPVLDAEITSNLVRMISKLPTEYTTDVETINELLKMRRGELG